MNLDNYDFNGLKINLYVDEQGEWLGYLEEMPNISAFGETAIQALEELKLAWELVKEYYQEKGEKITLSQPRLLQISSPIGN